MLQIASAARCPKCQSRIKHYSEHLRIATLENENPQTISKSPRSRNNFLKRLRYVSVGIRPFPSIQTSITSNFRFPSGAR